MSRLLPVLLLFQAALLAEPPNVVWIIADDMSPDTGAYGLKDVSTPNLDRLASEGRRYTRAYSSAPVCSSSRSAFILGCYQTTTGLHPHDVENPQPLPRPYKPLPTILREAGWFVTNAAAPGSERNGRVIKKAKTHYNFEHNPLTMFDGDDWRKRKPGQPFFAQFQITEPHRPFPIPEEFDEEKLRTIDIPPNYPDHPLMRRDWYAYHRSVEVVDRRVGAIIDQLKAEGVMDNTIVIFFADHGRPMPWGKQWLSVEGLQVPLIIRGPQIAANSVEERLVSLIDLAPSVLTLAGLPVPAWMEGRPVLSGDFPERDRLFAARDRCGEAMDRIRAVITADSWFVHNYQPERSRLNWSSYKEASYPGLPLLRVLQKQQKLDSFQQTWLTPTRPEWELYDLQTDPQGLHDVSAHADKSATLNELRTALDKWVRSSADRGANGDPSTEPPLPQIRRSKRADYERTWNIRLKKSQPSDEERLAWWMRSYGLAEDKQPR
ncbi:MAG: sulfatase [Prosthecobacter sp.]|jgi:N-sulfoglucosamine sulfohydrolase|uniref:sulfatase family protein n=1 Tax=Prosthecobacter sp. TaxID=1965333 RepID=UPI0019F63ECE|nr:sulfatase [Prosthecobacter sp.]MBE2286565.1 sulfatase [Prosthecobacter sp.]